jgi:hypothetical protein
MAGRWGPVGSGCRAARPVRLSPRHAQGHDATTAAPDEDLEGPGPDEYPLIASLLLVNKQLRQPSVRIIAARMMAGRAGKLAAWLPLCA